MRVVGVDLSLTASGLAQVAPPMNGGAPIWSFETVRSKASAKSIAARSARLLAIRDRCEALFYGGALVVIEAPAYMSQTGARHERSGLWWLVVEAAIRRGCRVVEVAPKARARYATGNGNAGKADVVDAVSQRYEVAPANDNEADAIALAALGMRLAGLPIEAFEEPWMRSVAETVLGDL